MRPIEIKVIGELDKSPAEICSQVLDTSRWSEFTGYSILPGVKQAHFEVKTPMLVGSRIRVQNTDGSTHVEEIIEWDEARKLSLKFQEFSTPLLGAIASQFIESWEFAQRGEKTQAIRKMRMYPKNWLGWLVLLPISRLMQKAFEQSLAQSQAGKL